MLKLFYSLHIILNYKTKCIKNNIIMSILKTQTIIIGFQTDIKSHFLKLSQTNKNHQVKRTIIIGL